MDQALVRRTLEELSKIRDLPKEHEERRTTEERLASEWYFAEREKLGAIYRQLSSEDITEAENDLGDGLIGMMNARFRTWFDEFLRRDGKYNFRWRWVAYDIIRARKARVSRALPVSNPTARAATAREKPKVPRILRRVEGEDVDQVRRLLHDERAGVFVRRSLLLSTLKPRTVVLPNSGQSSQDVYRRRRFLLARIKEEQPDRH